MLDILFLAHNRLAFTEASAQALRANTDWSQVRQVLVYDDNSTDGTREFLGDLNFPVKTVFRPGTYGGPVAVMNHAICSIEHDWLLAKVDNDTMVPAGWLEACTQVMRDHLRLDLLGIEAFSPLAAGGRRSYRQAEFIGGIGIMRLRAFITLPRPGGRFGFTSWQQKSPWVRKGWLDPALPVFLLDRMPLEPWKSLSAEYVAQGWQRDWGPYKLTQSALWDWWQK